MHRRGRIQKSILIFASLLIVFFIISIRVSATGYSSSLYRQIPVLTGIVFILVLFVCICGIVYSLYNNEQRIAVFWTIPLLSQYSLFFALPTLLGYQMIGPDLIGHITVLEEMHLINGFENEFRPGMYLVAMFLGSITALDPSNSFYTLGIVSVVIFFLLLAGLARRLNISIAPVWTAGIVPVTFYPTPAALTYSVYFILSLSTIFIWIGDKDRRWILLFCIIIAIMPLFHPLPAVMFAGLLTVALLLPAIRYRSDYLSINITGIRPVIGFWFISIVSIWLWLNYYQNIVGRAVVIAVGGITGMQRPETRATEDVTETVFGQFGYSFIEFIWLGIRIYGDIGLLVGVATLGLVGFALIRWHSRITTLHVVVLLLPPTIAVADFVVGVASGVGFARFFRPSLYLAPLFVGAGLIAGLELRDSQKRMAVTTVFVIFVLLTGTILFSTANHYDDPDWTLGVNENRLDSDIEGYSWYIEHKNRDKDTISLWRRFYRITWDLVPVSERDERLDEFREDRGEHRVPANFGGYKQLGSIIEFDSYYIESRSERAFLLEGMPGLNRLNEDDYKNINNDNSVDHIYTNNNIEIRYIDSNNQ